MAATPEPVDPVAPALRGPVLTDQSWRDVAFLHWFVPPGAVAPLLPAGVRPDLLPLPGEPRTAVGLVPFRMVGAGLGRGPAVPWLGSFWETNVRVYSVDATGRRGVVFLSLDASRLAVVVAARVALGLPYRWSRMRGAEREVGGVRELAWSTLASRWPGPRGLRSRVVVRVGAPMPDDAEDVALAQFLTARWGAHTAHGRAPRDGRARYQRGRTWYVPNTHGPWPLRRAELLTLDDELLGAAGLPDLARCPPDSVLFAEGVRTRFGLPGDARTPRR